MKKIAKLAALLTAFATLFALFSCGAEPADINVAVIKGPTGIGMVGLMDKNDAGKTANRYTFTLAGSPDEVVPKIATGEIDIAAVPTNLAATLRKKTNDGVKLLAVNTLGVLHIIENGETVKSVADLKGKTVTATGQGANPEYALRYILTENGIDPDKDVTLKFVGSNDELTAGILGGSIDVAMIPEPAATTVITKSNGVMRRALDLSSEWDKVSTESALMMGCVIVRTEFLENNEAAVKEFLKEYEKSIADCSDVKAAAALCEKYGIIPSAAIAEAAIPNCNLTYVAGKEMQSRISGYYEVLFGGNPASIGGELPPDGFYYLG